MVTRILIPKTLVTKGAASQGCGVESIESQIESDHGDAVTSRRR